MMLGPIRVGRVAPKPGGVSAPQDDARAVKLDSESQICEEQARLLLCVPRLRFALL
jgi:hypothetical protein